MSKRLLPLLLTSLIMSSGCQLVSDFFGDSPSASEQASEALPQDALGETKCSLAAKRRSSDTVNSCLEEAQNEDSKAMLAISKSYYFGYDGKPDMPKALEWLTKAAEANEAEAQYLLGELYTKGKHVNANPIEAEHWLSLAANANYVPAMIYLGNLYITGANGKKDTINGLNLLDKAAATNDPEAIVAASTAYINKIPGYLDCPKIKQLLDAGVSLKLTEAYAKYGLLYNEGLCVPVDLEQANANYLKAATQGEVSSQYNLGLLASKRGDDEEAQRWYKEAANNGHAKAQLNLGTIYASGKLFKNLDKALFWFLEAAKQGIAEAQYNAAVIFYTGNGVGLKDYQQAYIWATVAENCRTPADKELEAKTAGLELNSVQRAEAQNKAKKMLAEYGCNRMVY